MYNWILNKRKTWIQCLAYAVVLTTGFTMMAPAAFAQTPSGSFEPYLKRPGYAEIFQELTSRHKVPMQDLKTLFRQARYQPEIIERFGHPAEARPYARYRPLFIKPTLLAMGKQYLQDHRKIFESVERDYGVEKEFIAAILGVESKFGRYMDGGFRVFDALNTMFVGLTNRTRFARGELIQFVLLCREEGLDILKVKGSYAGAMGMPQFISSSYRHYAIDYDGDGKRDLWHSKGDVIGSVANYLKVHGWQAGMPVRLPVEIDPGNPSISKLLQERMKAQVTVRELNQLGVTWPDGPIPGLADQRVSLLSYQSAEGEKVVAVFSNFRTILRYNHAVNYALLIADLSELLVR